MSTNTRFWLPSVSDIFFLCTFLFLAFSSGNNLLNDADTGYHIRAGEYMINNLVVLRYDIFSYISPPLPWFAHEWLSEVIMALVYRLSGLTGVVIFFSILLALVPSLLFNSCRSLDRDIFLAVLFVLLATVSSTLHWLARPHIFSLVLTLIWYAILDQYQYKGQNRLYLLPPLMLLWANIHGGFVVGFLLIGIYLCGNTAVFLFGKEANRSAAKDKCNKLAAFTAICLIFSLFNPRGYSLLLFPFRMLSNQWLLDHVSEFLSPNFHESLPYKYLLLLMVGILALSRRAVNAIEVMLVVVFTYMSLYSARYIPFFAVIITPILLRQAESGLRSFDNRLVNFFWERSKNLELIDASTKGLVWPVLSVIGVWALALNGKIEFKFDGNKKPVAAVEFLKKEKIPGKMFNDDEFGDYLIYAAWPGYKVFLDGRLDMYGEAWGSQYLNIVTMRPGWEEVVEKNNFSWVFIGAEVPLSSVLLEKKNWRLIYADTVAYIFVKQIPENHLLIDKYPDVKPIKTPASSLP